MTGPESGPDRDDRRTDRAYESGRTPRPMAGMPSGVHHGPDDRQGSANRRLSDSAKSFAIAYLATLAVGIVVLFIVAQIMG